ncbi:hypothetical protein [Butyrivibrio sp. XPD2002]|uniref:hypothetical protein n=1 Tax=Butyrivibrio sp. XPD2002 TaxID=1280665 RepID=UPI0004108C61|nr:hypothetical protein [Butyrivibrio sp. XPD2002]
MKEWDRQRIHDRELTEKVTAEVTEKVITEVTEMVTDSINRLNAILIEDGRFDDLKKATEDLKYQRKLMEELLHQEQSSK